MGVEVELRFFAMFREAVGAKTIRREYDDGATVGDALRAIEREFPDLAGRFVDDDAVDGAVTVMRNGTNVANLDGLDTELVAGDGLSITPPVTGG